MPIGYRPILEAFRSFAGGDKGSHCNLTDLEVILLITLIPPPSPPAQLFSSLRESVTEKIQFHESDVTEKLFDFILYQQKLLIFDQIVYQTLI